MVNSMTRHFFVSAVLSVILLASSLYAQKTEKAPVSKQSLYDFKMKTIDGMEKSLSEYKGKVLLIVNVASRCGYTPQYKDLEEVYRQYKDRGFVVLGFPANNFGEQEPGTDQEIQTFCTSKYDVTFDMFSKISVRGDDQHPLYGYITKDSPFPGDVKWNFQKYLVDADGAIVAMYPSKTKPTDSTVKEKIEALLAKK